MCAVIIKRSVNFKKVRDDDEFILRRDQCASFRLRMKKLRITAPFFADLIGVSAETVYTWRSHTQRCIPPHPTALRVLALIEKDAHVISALEEISAEESD